MVDDYINMMKTTFDFNFNYIKPFQQNGYKITLKQREDVNLKSFSFICNAKNSLLTIKTFVKSRHHYIRNIAYHRCNVAYRHFFPFTTLSLRVAGQNYYRVGRNL